MYQFKREDAFRFADFVRIRAVPVGNELFFTECPYCHGKGLGNKNSFSINLENGLCKCFRESCGQHGNMVTLARDFDFKLSDDFSRFYEKRPAYKTLKQPKEPIIPKPEAITYLESRGISAATAEKYRITIRNDNKNVLCFPMFDTDGKLINVKYRNMNFTKDKSNGIKEWFEKNCMPYLYGVQSWNGSYDQMVLYEGQLDALSGYESGIENSFSVPGGAKGFTWFPPSYEFVSQFKELVIFGDCEKGHITLLEDMKQRFNGTIKHVRKEDYKDCKDANEILLKYGKEQVKQCVENAVILPIADVIDLADVEDVDIATLEKLSTGIRLLDRLLYGGLPFGGVHIVSGKPGRGKSTFASQILVNAIASGYKCFAYSGELPNYLFKSWINFQVAGGGHVFTKSADNEHKGYAISEANRNLISSWYRGKAYLYDNTAIDEDEHLGLLEATEKAIQQYGCRVILIDNLMTALDADASPGTDKYEKQSQFVKKLTRIAIRYDVLILLVAHKRKNNFSGDSNDEISGSGDISNLAMVTMAYDDDKEIEATERRLKVAKNRLFGRLELEGFVVRFDERSKRIFGDGDDPDREYGAFAGADDFMKLEDMSIDEIPFE